MTTTQTTAPSTPAPSCPPEPSPAAKVPALRIMAGGLAVAVAAAGLAAAHAGADTDVRSLPLPLPAAAPAPIVLNGPGDVSVVNVVYEVGQTSGWHAHAGIHAVAVVSGELAVYGPDCTRQSVAPGQPYVGGQELHVARNETDRPVEMIVTYLNAGRPAPHGGPAGPPPNCPVS